MAYSFCQGMSKPTAVRFIMPAGGLVFLYCLWCLRPQLLGPKLVFPESVPGHAREVIRKRYPPEPFDVRRGMELLRQPFEGRARVSFTHWTKPEGRHHTVHIPYVRLYEFEEADGKWSFVREGPLMSIH